LTAKQIKLTEVKKMNERILMVDYEDEMQQSFIDYAMSVIVQRALPDVRDGLKPVHRRILYAMYELGMTSDKPFKKSARIVGEVLGKYHPHGDSAVYDAMVRLAQEFNMMMPLVEGHGNFGSIDGDSAAAMRYTEARLSPSSIELLDDLDKRVVSFMPNFDNSLKEPTILPSKLPNLLVNGVTGIAVGMSTNIPSHNLNEVINGIIQYMDNPNITMKRLIKYIKGPDFPTGGIVANEEDLLAIYETGNGKLRIRAKVEVENAGQGKSNIVITEIPFTYSGSKTRFIETFINMAKDRKLEELTDIRDESGKEGIRIVLEVKRGVDIDRLLTKLYKRTPLEDTMNVNFLALVGGRPEVLNLKEVIHHYVEFQKEITLNKYRYLLNKAEERKEILEGLMKATDCIDTIIEVLRGSKDLKMAKDCLLNGTTDFIDFRTKKAEKQAKGFAFTERQTQAILDMKLQRLIQLEISKLEEDYNQIMGSIEECEAVLYNGEKLKEVIKNYLKEMKKKYGLRRKTKIDSIETKEYVEEVKEESLYVLVDRFGYVKATEVTNYKRSNEETINEFSYTLLTKNTDRIALFSNKGNFHQIKVMDIPKGKIKDKGVPVDTLTKMNQEHMIWLGNVEEVLSSKWLFVTKNGLVKIVDGSEFDTIRSMIQGTKLEEKDELITLQPIKDTDNAIFLVTKQHKGLKFSLDEVPLLKKNTKGVKGITLKEKDEVVDVLLFSNENDVTFKANDKTIDVNTLDFQSRNQKGISL